MKLFVCIVCTLAVKFASSQLVLEHYFESVGVGGRSIDIPVKGPYRITVDWGDGSRKESFEEVNASKTLFSRSDRFISHSYSKPGIKTITITGSLTEYGSSSPDLDNSTLRRVLSWDGLGIKSFKDAFYGATSLISVPASLPASVTNISGMFSNAAGFNGAIGSWNTVNVNNMYAVFFRARSFNQPIGNWNTANVVDMGEMFSGAKSFNQPIGNWNVSNVLKMSGMFNMALSFNQPLENWNTSRVQDMHGMFFDAVSFNQPIDNWNTGSVNQVYDMFNGAASFNQPINNWNVSAVTSFNRMFLGAVKFNRPLANWNTANATNMTEMFSGARSFNQPIGNWNISKVTRMKEMFRNAVSFDQELNWDLSSVTDRAEAFFGAVNTSRAKGRFVKGKKTGKWTYSYDNGNTEATGEYDDNGFPKAGSWIFYDRSGKVEAACGQLTKDENIRFCHSVYTQREYTGKEEGETRFSFELQKNLWDMACAYPSYNCFEVGKVKIQLMWMKNRELFLETKYINSPALELNVAKLDAAALTPRFTFEATRRYHLDMNFIDPADGKTLLDFIRDRINREMKYVPINEGRVYEYERTYYILRKYLNAKHAVELRN